MVHLLSRLPVPLETRPDSFLFSPHLGIHLGSFRAILLFFIDPSKLILQPLFLPDLSCRKHSLPQAVLPTGNLAVAIVLRSEVPLSLLLLSLLLLSLQPLLLSQSVLVRLLDLNDGLRFLLCELGTLGRSLLLTLKQCYPVEDQLRALLLGLPLPLPSQVFSFEIIAGFLF